MTFGSGVFTDELADGWGELPEGHEWNQVAGVAVDKNDNVYAFNRSAHRHGADAGSRDYSAAATVAGAGRRTSSE